MEKDPKRLSLEIPESPISEKRWSSGRAELDKIKPMSMNETALGDFMTSPKSEFTLNSENNLIVSKD